MRGGNRVAVAAALVTALLTASGPAVVTGVGTAGAATHFWAQVPTERISGMNFYLNAVATPAAGDVWVVGDSYDGTLGEWRAQAEHYNGSRFVIIPMQDRETAPAADFLEGASGAAPDDIWAVGDSATSSPSGNDATLMEHWDGTVWRIVPSPDPGSLANILTAVSARTTTDVWSVGAVQDTGTFYQRPLAIHWNGSAWIPVAFPNPASCDEHSFLSGVSAVGANDVWAVGWCEQSGIGNQGYVGHWDGTSWRIVAGVGVLPKGSVVSGISAAGPSNVWVVGYCQVPGQQTPTPLTAHWDGKTWQVVTIPGIGWSAVTTRSPNGVWTVGTGPRPRQAILGPLSAHYDAGAWHTHGVGVANGALDALGNDPAGPLWAAGSTYGVPLVLVRR